MNKNIIALFIILTATLLKTTTIFAQTASAAGSQKVSLALANVVQISQFNGQGSNGTVSMPLTTAATMSQGVESPLYTVSINSTDGFDVKAQAVDEYFTYSGSASTTPAMKVADVLELKVVQNNTTGNIAGGHTQYQPIPGTNQSPIIQNGNRGANQTFAVQYKATPGYNYPGGLYTAAIMYTVTQF